MAMLNLFGRKNRIKKQKRKIARTVQQSIPIDAIYKDGIFRTGQLFSKSWKFSDINYAVASDDDQLQMFLAHSAILNGLPTDAMAEITIYNRQLHNKVFEQITTPSDNPNYRKYTQELNGILCDKMSESNNIVSITIQPIPTDEAVKIVQKKLLAIETDITKWQQKQNENNNFSANIPYEMEQMRKEIKEFLDDLTIRDQRMMFVTVTLLRIADSLEQLDNDTETLMSIGRKYLCNFATLKYQQEDTMKNKMTEKLFELAYTDSMTEVQNRNAYEERLKKLRKPNANISRITVVVVDVNGLKEINDSYGHFSGDDAIKTVAKALRDTIGIKADIYRIGGDEFVCISESNVLPYISQFKDTIYFINNEKLYNQSVSIGYSKFHEKYSKGIDDIICRADEKMYKEKKSKK